MRRFLDRPTKWIFSAFRRYFRALNATICWCMIHKLFIIQKYGWSFSFRWNKTNVLKPKLIVNETNEFLKNFQFFKKKWDFFKFWESPEKNSSWSCFFWKSDSTSKLSKIVSDYFLTFLKVLLESSNFNLNNLRLSFPLNGTTLSYLKSPCLEAKITQC